MPADSLSRAVANARTYAQLDETTKFLWQVHGAGGITDAEAEAQHAIILVKRAAIKSGFARAQPVLSAIGEGKLVVNGPPARSTFQGVSKFQPRKPQRAPDRRVSIERRRTLAASGVMPSSMASRFTTGEIASLRIIADEFMARGVCHLALDAIAARAGTSRSVVKRALKLAVDLGMVTVDLRPVKGDKHKTNAIRIVDKGWLVWLRRRTGGGVQNGAPTGSLNQNIDFSEKTSASRVPLSEAARLREWGRWRPTKGRGTKRPRAGQRK